MAINHEWIVQQSVVCTVENEEIRLVRFSVAEILYEEIKRLQMQINCEKFLIPNEYEDRIARLENQVRVLRENNDTLRGLVDILNDGKVI